MMYNDRFSHSNRHYSNSYPYNNPYFSNYEQNYSPPSNSLENRGSCNKKSDYIEFLGIKLSFDDLLIIGLLFFLYKEEVNDMTLYIALILLLLS